MSLAIGALLYAAFRGLLGNAFVCVAPVDPWVSASSSLLRLTQKSAEERRSEERAPLIELASSVVVAHFSEVKHRKTDLPQFLCTGETSFTNRYLSLRYRVPTLREQYRGGALIACPVRVPNCYQLCFLSVVVVVSRVSKEGACWLKIHSLVFLSRVVRE